MLDYVHTSNVLFIDIETVSQHHQFDELTGRMHKLWEKKGRALLRIPREEEVEPPVIAQAYQDRAAVFAEFGKICCISIGFIKIDVQQNTRQLRIRSFFGHDEKIILEEFAAIIKQYFDDPEKFWICGHNIKEFDVPYICRRMLVHRLRLPEIFNLPGKKPWETKHLLDTMQLWKFGDIKHYTSLETLACIFNIPTPKDDIDGSMVGTVYWDENNIDRIAEYCEKDVVTVAQVLLFMKNEDLLQPEEIVFKGK